jgi:hypothetical protein
MNLDDYKQSTPESEMSLQHFSITVSFIIHESDREKIKEFFNSSFPTPFISFRDVGGNCFKAYAEFNDEYNENDVEDLVRDALYPTLRDMGVIYNEIVVAYD